MIETTTDSSALEGKYIRMVIDIKAEREKTKIRELNERLEKLR